MYRAVKRHETFAVSKISDCINIDIDILIDKDISVNCIWVDTRWQQYSTHLHTNSTQNSTINLGRVLAVPRLCELYSGICLTSEEKARKNLSQGSRRVPVGTMKTGYTEQNIPNNKNT
jgi:hypothetical protein